MVNQPRLVETPYCVMRITRKRPDDLIPLLNNEAGYTLELSPAVGGMVHNPIKEISFGAADARRLHDLLGQALTEEDQK